MRHVPYKGGGAAAMAIITGEVGLMIGTLPSVLPHVRSERLRAIAVASERRSKSLPDVPTIAETLPGVVVSAWYGLQVPAGTPREIVGRLNAEIVKAVATESVARTIVNVGLEPLTSSPEQFAAHIRGESARWAKVLQDAGIPPS